MAYLRAGMDFAPRVGPLQKLSTRAPRWCLLVGLFLVICGAKLWLIDRFGSSTPIGDEWGPEAGIIQSYREGTLSLRRFVAPHNEHRIAFSRALCLALFLADRQWDPFLMMVAQAPIGALVFVVFIFLAGGSMSGAGKAAAAGFAALLGALPLCWENTLWAFQSGFYFMMLFGIVVIWLCWRHGALSAGWWLGALLAFASLFTMAGGVLPVIAVALFAAGRFVAGHCRGGRKEVAGIAILSAISVFGVLITPGRALHANLVAGSPREFLWALTGILSWPCDTRWACVIIQAPFLLLAITALLRRVPLTDARWYLIITGASCWLQALATAYRRCKDWNSLRYCDCWTLGLIVMAACLCVLPRTLAGRWRLLLPALAVPWLALVLFGALNRAIDIVPGQLIEKRAATLEMEDNLRRYLATGDGKWLEGKIPFPRVGMVQSVAAMESVRDVLPSSLVNPNSPLVPSGQIASGGAFTAGGVPSGMPDTGAPVIGSFTKTAARAKSRITLQFDLPPGTRKVDLQVAGYPNAAGISLKADQQHRSERPVALLDPGMAWETIGIPVNPKSPLLRINATDESRYGWVAFSMPAVSPSHAPSEWARALAGKSLYLFTLGVVLLATGALEAGRDR